MPATSIAAPTLLDPVAPVRVDQASYSIRGLLQQPAKNGTTVQAYRDGNLNGRYDAGVDPLVATVRVAKQTRAFTVPAGLRQNADNRFFLIAVRGKLRSTPVATALITEDSRPPRVMNYLAW